MIRVQIDDRDLQRGRAVLADFPNRFIESLLVRSAVPLKRDAPKAFSTLANSINWRMTGHGEGQIGFNAKYAKFVHDGRGPGGFPNVEALRDWVKVKRLAHPDDGDYDDTVFRIGRHIQRFGTEPQPWVNDFIKSARMRRLEKQVAKQELSRVG